MQIWTAQLCRWRKLQEANIEVLNIALKGGIELLAPTRNMLSNYRANIFDTSRFRNKYDAYTYQYLELMRYRYSTNREFFDQLVERLYWAPSSIALCCYCPPGHFCHRHLLLDILMQIAESKGYRLQIRGEFT